MPASYPSSAKSFTTKSDGAGNTIQAAHVNDLQLEISAIETDLIAAFPGGSAASGQIKFPATQNPSSSPNTLDDYEEGTWTPVIGGAGGTSGQTYTTQYGSYVKVGKAVTVSGYAVLSAKGTITGTAVISGLPFAVGSEYVAVSIPFWNAMGASFVSLGGFATTGASTVTLIGATAAASGITQLTTSDFADTSQLMFTFTYMASA